MSTLAYINRYKYLNDWTDRRLKLGLDINMQINAIIEIRHELAIIGELGKIL